MKSNTSQRMKLTHNAKIIINELCVDPMNASMWHNFSSQTGNWGLGIMKTVTSDNPNSYMLTSIDMIALKEFLLNNQELHNKYKILKI